MKNSPTAIHNEAFDAAYTQCVEEPWRSAAGRFPWQAPDRLRAQWKQDMVHSPAPLQRLVSAVGLSRSSELSLDEMESVDTYFRQQCQDGIGANADVTALLLCTGASPPPALFPAYFEPCLKASAPHPPPILWLCLSWYLRSCANAEIASAFLRKNERWWSTPYGRFIIVQSLLNPVLRPAENLFHEWLQAEATFHPGRSHPCASWNTDLLFFAWALRWDTGKIPANIQPALRWISAQKFGVAPLEIPLAELGSPSRATIQSFTAPTELNEIYKFYLPLLRFPWETPSLPAFPSEGSVLGLALAGHPPFMDWCDRHAHRSLYLLEKHPCWSLF